MVLVVLSVTTLVLTAVLQGVHGAPKKLPPGLTPCARNDPKLNECALRNANLAIPFIAKGNPAYGMLPQDPLHVPEFRIDDTGTSRQVALNLAASNITITGLKHARLRTMNLKLNESKAEWTGFVPRVSFVGKYNVSGNVLILPIRGRGDLNITLDNVIWKYTFDIVSADDNMNAFLNENWREMVKDLGPPIVGVLSAATNQVIEAIMRVVPYDEMFPESLPA
ncbi:hypothetical protein B566_EDAN009331 [Ephemera danica]|nr:hypothetical protein B566_EDAN009331 [Ephemera danica]